MYIINANVLTMDGPDIPNGYVRISDGKIAAVGSMDELGAIAAADDDLLDLKGKTLMPGFIDAHSHLGLFEDGMGAEGDDINEDADPVTPHIRALDGINPFDRGFTEARQAGVTCAVISPGSANPISGQICAVKTCGRRADDMLVAPALGLKFALGENPKMSYGNKAQSPVTRMATAALIREQLLKASRYMRDKQRAADEDGDEPDFDVRMEALLPLLRGEARAHFHAHKAYDILTAVRIAKEFSLDYTLIHCTEGYLIADILAGLGARAVCGPLLLTRTKPELVGMSAENCGVLASAGVLTAISTDYPEAPAGFLAASASLAVAGGMTRRAALEAITIAAARTAGLEDRLGSITPGKDADILVFAEDPFNLGVKPELVFMGGKIVDSY